MSVRDRVVALAGLGAGAGTLVVVAALLHRTLTPIREIGRYVDDIEAAIADVARNLEATSELEHTRDTAVAVPALATAWLEGSR